jgi:type IV secretory pathway VirB10-like protein
VEPKDNRKENEESSVKPIEAPSGLELHPTPKHSVRLNRRASLGVGAIGLLLLLGFAYGGYRRQVESQVTAREAGLPKNVVPATTAGTEFTKDLPGGQLVRTVDSNHQLQPPGTSAANPSCGTDPKSWEPYHFDPQTGRPRPAYSGISQERVVARQGPVVAQTQISPQAQPEPSPEQKRLLLAYQRDQEARLAPTQISNSSNSAFKSPSEFGSSPNTQDDISRVAAVSQALAGNRGPDSAGAELQRMLAAKSEDAADPNSQTREEAFLASARTRQTDDYLRSTRTAPLSSYEIKAGWEIPAVLEQGLNSDLPGELKALVTLNVYDTATGRYLLIPQGSRLVGRYDSHVTYGQDGVQVVWERIVYPDGSSVDLNGMVGLDSHGNAGLRDHVDHHYKRLLGFAALTSMFNAGFAMSQPQGQSILAYPSAGQLAAEGAARDMSESGAEITRKNLNTQPTIKVPIGYKFTVRVNRDMLFDAPYHPIPANDVPIHAAGSIETTDRISGSRDEVAPFGESQ